MMRTLTTLLLLVCFAWSQAAAAECHLAARPGGASDVHADAHAHHHGHTAPVPAGDDNPHHHGPAQHASTGCGMLTSCGAATAPPVLAQPAAAFAQAAHGPGADRGAYTSPSLSTEPPPPRVDLRS
ncbi:hypothetical protein [Longimicrobium sp.]|uniref:hypothetical protein n=1 Tax=Longimicrobium sp. TaxID=2029185 RepID=UPI002E30C70C|nr:hypothetical protein [Longimicrobium sp.]HEX6037831.1 hypothetical protein [Longimicrobium sp.]